MKKIAFFMAVSLMLFVLLPTLAAARTYIDSDVTSNTTWDISGSPYVISGNIFVESGVTLTINPNVVVKFEQYGSMNIYGTLVADGEPGQQIYFTSIKDDAVGGDTNDDGDTSSPAPGDWYYLYFYGNSPGNLLDNVVVRYGGSGSGSVYINTSSPMTVSNSVIEQGLYYGIYAYNTGEVTLTNNTISDNGQYGIYGVYSTMSVTGNTISGHTTAAIYLDINSFFNSTIGTNTLSDNAINTIVIGGTLSEDATWDSSYGTYVVDYLTVPNGVTLTILPGTVVKFARYGSMNINGTLVADGELGQQIHFTSINDDEVGGDTNGDGDDSSPAPGDWYYLYFYGNSPGNLLDNVVVRYGGNGSGSVYINTSSPMTVSNSVIEQGLYYGIYLSYAADATITNNTISDNGQYGIYGAYSTLSVTGNTISGHTTGAIHLDVNSLLNPDSEISNNTLSDNVLDTIVIGGTLSEDATWDSSYGTYVVDYLTVADGATLTIEPGTVVKFARYGYMYIYGTLVADGEPGLQIYFTSINDDAVGGDTNGDGDDSSPAPGDWYYLYFYGNSPGNLLDSVVVRYGGSGSGSVYINTSSPMTVSNSVIEQGLYYGIYAYNTGEVTLTNNTISDNGQYGIYGYTSSLLDIDGNTISGHTTAAIYLDINSLRDATIGTNTLSGNAVNAILTGGTLGGNATWSPDAGTYVVDYLTVNNGATLTIEPGTVVKFARYGSMNIYGTLVADGEPGLQIYFTSVNDDDVGGDTNGDGSTISPAPGDWNNLYLFGADPGNLLDNVVVRYGGSGSGSLYLNTSAAMTVSNSTIENGLNFGIYLYNADDVTLSGNTILNNGQYGIYGDTSTLLDVDGNTISGHTESAIYLDINSLMNATIGTNTLSGNAVNAILTGGTLGGNATWSPDDGTYVVNYLTVADGATLTIEPGTVVKFAQYGSMYIYGTLVADGEPGLQIYFTSINDDEVGGDTNGDEDDSSPAPGDWNYLYFYEADPGNLLENVVVRFGGAGNGSLYIYASPSITVSNSVIEDSLYYGIYLYNAADITLTDNTIQGNSYIGIYLNNSTGVTISKNRFQNNGQYGIYCANGSDPVIGGSEANANAIYGHASYGVINTDPSITLNATNNYWGHSSGPSGFGSGTGDAVSDYVDFDPWIGTSPFDLAPTVSDIPDQTTDEGGTFVDINLDDYVSDADNADDEISWTYSGNTDLTVNIVNRVATIDIPGNWTGAETITFTATDPGGLSDAEGATFTVNDTGLGESSACDDDAECSSGNCVNAVTAPWYPANIGACCPLDEFWAIDHCEPCVESDGDEVCDWLDNCPAVFNADQADADSNGVGDICDAVSDTDGDGLSDADEVNLHGTDPANPDSDGDWVGDGVEINNNTNPNNPDEFTPPGTGAIKGTVNDSGGFPITTNDIRVQVITGDPCGGWQQIDAVLTSDGNYIIVGLDPGQDYWVRTDNMWQSNYVNAWYGSPSSSIECNGAQLLNVPENGSADGTDFQLDMGAEISGTVYQADGSTAIKDAPINVTAFRAGDPCQGHTYTWSLGTQTDITDGSFTLKGVPVGTDSVYLSTNNMNQSNHVNEYWRNTGVGSSTDCFLAELLDVPADGVTGLSFQLDLGGSVSGYVTDASDDPIPNLWVHVNDSLCGSGQWFGGDETDVNGYYQIMGIRESGDVFVQTCAHCWGLGWVDEWWDGIGNTGSIDCNGAAPIGISPGLDSGGIDFQLDVGGIISGAITRDSDGQPVGGISIQVWDYDSGWGMGNFQVEPNGSYTITGLAPGSYRLMADATGSIYASEYYNNAFGWDSATRVDVTAGGTTPSIDFSLGTGGSISGVVTADAGGALGNIWIWVENYQNGSWFGGSHTQPNGAYTISGLPPGDYRVHASTGGTPYAWEWYNDTYDRNSAQAVSVVAESDTPNIHFGLAMGGTISGEIRREGDNQPLPGMRVVANRFEGGWGYEARTQSNGTYTIEGIATGGYRIEVDPEGSNYIREYYDDTTDWNAASRVVATAGVDTPGIDFLMTPGFPINGTMMRVKKSNGDFITKYEIEIPNFEGTLPGDIDTISIKAPSGATLPYTKSDFTYLPQWKIFSLDVDGSPPELGRYTFTVTSGAATGTDTDFYYIERSLPAPDIATFSPADGSTINSKTPSFTWDAVDYGEDIALYYRLEIMDAAGENRVYASSRMFNTLYHTVPEGTLLPNTDYTWRVRVSDSDNWEYVENRTNSELATFTVAGTLAHTSKPAIFPNDWLAATYSYDASPRVLLWLRVLDHDGVASDGSSHEVSVTLPGGDSIPMQFDVSEAANTVAYYAWDNNPPASGQYTFTVTDPDGNVGTLVEDFTYNPLDIPDADSLTPSNKNPMSEYITATYDNIEVNGVLYDDFDAYTTIDDLDYSKWVTNHPNASIVGGKLVLSVSDVVGRGDGHLSFKYPETINSIKADITVSGISDPDGPPKAEIKGTWCSNARIEINAGISVVGSKVYYSVWEDYVIDRNRHWKGASMDSGELMTGISPGQTITAEISLSGNTLTFTANGNTKAYTIPGVIYPVRETDNWKSLRTRINLVTDTTPTFTWAPVTNANRYRARIYNWDKTRTVANGYTGNATSYTFPPGILVPDAYYTYRFEAWDALDPLNVDNVSKTPASNDDNYRFYTGSEEAVDPFIDLRGHGVHAWNDPVNGQFLSFWVQVHDAQGVPENIKSVKVEHPSGAITNLESWCSNPYTASTPTSCIYENDSEEPIEIGTYTFTVEDLEGHVFVISEDLTPDVIGFPAVASLSPADGTLLNSTAVNFDWDDVPGAVFYVIDIYDYDYKRAYQFYTAASEYNLPEGFLKENELYRWRIQSRREFFSENVDNGSSSPDYWNMLTFTTTPPDDSEPDGMPDDWESEHGLDPGVDDSNGDLDGDGLINIDEYNNATDPDNPDSDGDGYNDGLEISQDTNPINSSDYFGIPNSERNALKALYSNTNGDGWTDNSGWKTPPLAADGFAVPGTECSWFGIACDASEDHVVVFFLSENLLSGNIPVELGNLNSLQYLYLFNNQLTGTIPAELGNLNNILTLDLSSNQLTDSIPTELGNLSNALHLYLYNNQLTGTIPAELGNLTNLQHLYLYNNQLTGTIPAELGNLTNLTWLWLSDNQLTNSIPTELGNLNSLLSLGLHNNQLTGSIPTDLGNLNNLQGLFLNNNQLTGAIPTELGNLANLEILNLWGNKLAGPIPDTLNNLTQLFLGQSDFRWNALYTNNTGVRDLLNTAQSGGDWESTQTVAPENLSALTIAQHAVALSWAAIPYTGDTGTYEVELSTDEAGPYTLAELSEPIADKTVENTMVVGLADGTTYYFRLRTVTDPHGLNQNAVYSEYSEIISATTGGAIVDSDGDGVLDEEDNCPQVPNSNQNPGMCEGLNAYYPFNGNAIDESGNGFGSVAIEASLTADRFENANRAYVFDGVNDYITLPNSETILGANPSEWSYSVWFLANSEITSATIINDYNSNIWDDRHGISLGISDMHIRATAREALNDQTTYRVLSDQVIEAGVWYFATVVVSKNEGTIKLFVNGIFVNETPINTSIDYIENVPINIGRNIYYGAGNGYFNGVIDNVRIYSRALSSPEIAEIYTESLNQGLVTHYSFDGNANDNSGNGNDGSVIGATLTADRFGNPNSAYSFDGVNDYIKASANNLPTAERTVSLWFFANTNDRMVHLGYGGSGPPGTAWFMGINGWGQSIFYMSSHYDNNTIKYFYYQPPVGAWYHFVAASDPNGTRIYINGVEEATNSNYVANTIVQNKDLSIGVCVGPYGTAPYVDANVGYFNGIIDDIRIYNRALSDAEIQTLSYEGASQMDTDGDGIPDFVDPDDDNDNVSDAEDTDPLDANICRDADADGCDDCSSGVDDPANDGVDTDGDGLCDPGDTDADGDGFDSEAAGGPDCNDLDAEVHPGAAELPGDGIDQDCDGSDAIDISPAVTYHVDPVNGTDDASHGGDSGSAAWKSLHYAIQLINSGPSGAYTLNLATGTYTFASEGSDTPLVLNQDIIINGGAAILDGSGIHDSAAENPWTTGLIISEGAENVQINNLTIRGFKYGMRVSSSGGCLTTTYVTIDTCETGMKFAGSSQLDVNLNDSTWISGCTTAGVEFVAASSNIILRNGTVRDNAGDGIRVEDAEEAPESIRIEHMLVENNDGYGILLSDGFYHLIYDCDVVGNNLNEDAHAGIGVFTGNTTVTRNTIQGNLCLGVYADDALSVEPLDATYNYWGTPSGPSGEGSGTGDGVSENALFMPWFGSAPDIDTDGDGVADVDDNCPANANADQADADGDDIGDPCDPDADGDGFNSTLFAGNDCGDNDASIYPGALEIPNDDVDQDCDGSDLISDLTAGSYFVDVANGSDDPALGRNSGNQAWGSLKFALRMINSGASGDYVLNLAPGTYSPASEVLDIPLTVEQNLTLIGPGAVLDGSGDQQSAKYPWKSGIIISPVTARITLEGLTIQNFEQGILVGSEGGCLDLIDVIITGCDTGIQLAESYQMKVDLHDSTVTGCRNGIEITAGSSNNVITGGEVSNSIYDGILVDASNEAPADNLIDGVQILNNARHGVALRGGSGTQVINSLLRGNNKGPDRDGYGAIAVLSCGASLRWNTIEDNGCAGIYADEATALDIHGNLIRDNRDGIRLAYTADVTVENNTITENVDGLVIEDGSSPDIIGNIIWNNGLATDLVVMGAYGRVEDNDVGTTNLLSMPANNISQDPKFKDPSAGDYSLEKSSACIDAMDIVEEGRDCDNGYRPLGHSWDLGAFESPGYADEDDDDLPDWWEQRIADANGGDAIEDHNHVNGDDDFDGDGVSNWNEWLNGTDPTTQISVTITVPADNPAYTDLATIAIEGLAESAASVELSINGSSPIAAEMSGDSWSAAGINLQSGQNLIVVTARGVDTPATDNLTIIRDAQAPAVAIIDPVVEGEFPTSADSISINGLATDDSGLSAVTWLRQVEGQPDLDGDAQGLESWDTGNIPLVKDSDENTINTITIGATDRFGNSGSVTLQVRHEPAAAIEENVPLEEEDPGPEVDEQDRDGDKYLNEDESSCLGEDSPAPNDPAVTPPNYADTDYPSDPAHKDYDETKVGYKWPDCINPDDDDDGLEDECELVFGSTTSAQGPADDYDLDGVTNLQECVDGTDLKQAPASDFQLTITDLSGTKGYNDWLPGFGRVLKIEATMVGDQAPATALFSLQNTSSYPGRAVNDPAKTLVAIDRYPGWYEYNGFDFGLTATNPITDATVHSFEQGPISAPGTVISTDPTVVVYEAYLQCWDYGARTMLVVKHSSNSEIRSELWVPKGSGANGISSAWQYDSDATYRLDGNADIDKIVFDETMEKYPAPQGDDFNNFEEYRGILYYPAAEMNKTPETRVLTHQRLNPHRKDLFVRAQGYDDAGGDPYRPFNPPEVNGTPQWLTYDPFRLGQAFKNAGIDVHNTTGWGHDVTEDYKFFIYYRQGTIEEIKGSIVKGIDTQWLQTWPLYEWEFKLDIDPGDQAPTQEENRWLPVVLWEDPFTKAPDTLALAFGYKDTEPVDLGTGQYAIRMPLPHINVLIVRHDHKLQGVYSSDAGFIRFISATPPDNLDPTGSRHWSWATKGLGISNPRDGNKGIAMTLKKPLDHIFGDKPYLKGTVWDADAGIWRDAAGNEVTALAPLARCEDQADQMTPIDGIIDGDFENGVWDGDRRLGTYTEWVADGQLSPFDVDGDGFIELPFVSDPNDADPGVLNPDFEYTKAHVLMHTTTHEVAHAIGAPSHTDVDICLMYRYSNNYNRANYFSNWFRSLLRINNRVR